MYKDTISCQPKTIINIKRVHCPLLDVPLKLDSNNNCKKDCIYAINGCAHPINSNLSKSGIIRLKGNRLDLVAVYKERIRIAIIFDYYINYLLDNYSYAQLKYFTLNINTNNIKIITLKWLKPILIFNKVLEIEYLSILKNREFFKRFVRKFHINTISYNQFFKEIYQEDTQQ